MSDSDYSASKALYQGLQTLAQSSFPKRCRDCGRIYHDVEEFIAETRFIKKDTSGLQAKAQDNGTLIVELYRNCPCGSTLMDIFNNRRDVSENGIKRRNTFDDLMATTQSQYQIDAETARTEILNIMDGQSSDILKDFIPDLLTKP